MLRQGNWTTQAASGASGGSYLYSSSPDDVLTLYFTGTTIEVVYVAGMTLGILALEVDGIVLRSVITTAETTQFGSRAKIDYLTDEGHTLRVYASQGVVAVDAFYGMVVSSIKSDDSTSVVAQAESRYLYCDGYNLSIVSQATGWGTFGNDYSYDTDMSADGRYVVFTSYASNLDLVSNDTNGLSDIFLRDRQTCVTTRVSVDTNGTQAIGGNSYNPSISADGNYIVFESNATNLDLVVNDTNDYRDIFVHRVPTAETFRVSLTDDEQQANGHSYDPVISDDGQIIAFESTASNLSPYPSPYPNVYVRNRQANTTTKIGGSIAYNPSISGDGHYITFASNPTYPIGGSYHVYLYDRVTFTPTMMIGPYSSEAIIARDGNYVMFSSDATNLVPNDTNNLIDLFRYNRTGGNIARVYLNYQGLQIYPGGQPYDYSARQPDISNNGNYIAFRSFANYITSDDDLDSPDLFVRAIDSGNVIRLQRFQNHFLKDIAMSGDGRYVAFDETFNLISPYHQIYVRQNATAWTDTLALFNQTNGYAALIDTLQFDPPPSAFTTYPTLITSAQWVMGDWNGDGQKTPGYYKDGAFYYTNDLVFPQTGPQTGIPPSGWTGIWIGLIGKPAVAGRFDSNRANDCIGAVDSSNFPPYGTAFALYFTCDLIHGPTPELTFQWLSVLLPDSQGFAGPHQFTAGDWNADGIDSIAVRRGPFISFTNVPPTILLSEFNLAQYIGDPYNNSNTLPADYPSDGFIVSGDWDNNGTDSFGLFYQDGWFIRRNDLDWNSGVIISQYVNMAIPFGTTQNITATSWRLK